VHHRFSHDVLIGGNVPTSHARGYMIASDLVLQEVSGERAIRLARSYVGTDFSYFRSATDSAASQTVRFPSVDAPFQARERRCGRNTAAGLYGSSRTGSRSPEACCTLPHRYRAPARARARASTGLLVGA
jgi:hypothetical protein